MSRAIRSTIYRLGQEVVVKTRSETNSNAFNNPESTWSESYTTQCVRTYPNRNTQIESGGGPYDQDRALFIFERGEDPDTGSRIVYDGSTYEVKSPTKYDTHVAVFCEPVSE